MNIEEIILKRQIDFNNNWPTEKEVNTEALHLFLKRMDENKLNQLLVPVIVKENEAFATFSIDKELAKIFSAYLDVFHFLPLHPDLAFDNIWRTLEYTIKLYAKRAWNYGAGKGVADCFRRVATEVVEPMVNKEESLEKAYVALFNNMSVSLANYITVRLLYTKQLSIAPQIAFVQERAEQILPDGLLNMIRKAYSKKDGTMDAKNIRDIGRRLARLIQGKDFEFGGNKYNSIGFADRVHFLLSVVLYTSRCERFHGDIYSPFKSSISSLNRYYEYYYLTLASLLIFWTIINKIVERDKNLAQFIEWGLVKKSVEETLQRMNNVLTNK
ncbi:hypothetical protein [Prevotella merdae]|uniref:hypothetical protein n=1 Tax=Prevotella merdae TaxID=2079531 RepID=UPI003566A593